MKFVKNLDKKQDMVMKGVRMPETLAADFQALICDKFGLTFSDAVRQLIQDAVKSTTERKAGGK
jgi:hypothetical protein